MRRLAFAVALGAVNAIGGVNTVRFGPKTPSFLTAALAPLGTERP